MRFPKCVAAQAATFKEGMVIPGEPSSKRIVRTPRGQWQPLYWTQCDPGTRLNGVKQCDPTSSYSDCSYKLLHSLVPEYSTLGWELLTPRWFTEGGEQSHQVALGLREEDSHVIQLPASCVYCVQVLYSVLENQRTRTGPDPQDAHNLLGETGK